MKNILPKLILSSMMIISMTSFAQVGTLTEEVEKLSVSPEYKFIVIILGVVILTLGSVVVYQNKEKHAIETNHHIRKKELLDSKDKLHEYILSITEKVVMSSTGVQNVLEIIKENNNHFKDAIEKDHSEIKISIKEIKESKNG